MEDVSLSYETCGSSLWMEMCTDCEEIWITGRRSGGGHLVHNSSTSNPMSIHIILYRNGFNLL